MKLRQSVCRWCYEKMPLEELARNAKEIGLVGIDLVTPDGFGTLKTYGLIGTMTPSHSIEVGLNDRKNHEQCLAKIRDSIDATSAACFSNVICFSGNCEGIPDDVGLVNCAAALKQVVGLAEKKKIVIHMELLNARLDHPDYMCHRSAWGAALAQKVGSPNFKLLFDIYHMQVDEGDIIASIRRFKDSIGHYHTGGVPGRNEIDNSQELNYPAIMRAIADTGFSGFVAHEFIPKRDPMRSLKEAFELCTV